MDNKKSGNVAGLTPEQLMRGTIRVFPTNDNEKATQKALDRYAESSINLVWESTMATTMVEMCNKVLGSFRKEPAIHPSVVFQLLRAYAGAAAVYHQLKSDLPIYLDALGIKVEKSFEDPDSLDEAFDAIEAYLQNGVAEAVAGGLDPDEKLSDEKEALIKQALGGDPCNTSSTGSGGSDRPAKGTSPSARPTRTSILH